MSGPETQIQQDTKHRISMARMLCVLGMIFVHVPDGMAEKPVYSFDFANLGMLLEGFLVEGPGRASAGLLSIVSGYLAAIALMRRVGHVRELYKRRFVSIVLPMIFWAVATVIVYLGVSLVQPTFLDDATTLLDKLNIIFFITEMPMGATMHLAFLRDLFVCILLSPLLLLAVQRMPWVLLPLLALFYLFGHGQSFVVIFRPLILFAFSIGLLLAARNVNLAALDRLSPVFVALALIATALIIMVNGGVATGLVDAFASQNLNFKEMVLYPLSRLFGSLAIWTLIPMLMGGRFQSLVLRFSPYLFAAFCSHYLVLTVLFFGVWQPLFGDRTGFLFTFWFLAAPVTAMLMAVFMVKLTSKFSPSLTTVITGGRVRAKQVSTPIADRQRQGVVLGIWLVATHVVDTLTNGVRSGMRAWLAASRRLLAGRR